MVFLFLLAGVAQTGRVQAADNPATEMGRKATIVMTYTRYEWWLLQWTDSKLACQVYIDHEGWPTGQDVLTDCGATIYNQWLKPNHVWFLVTVSSHLRFAPGYTFFTWGALQQKNQLKLTCLLRKCT
jgi:hypothetical protein